MKHKKLIILIFFILLLPVIIYFAFGGLTKDESENLVNLSNGSTLLFAHRGIANYYPENSDEALFEAKKLDFKAVEIDLNNTSDDSVVLFHDSDTKRMLGLNGSIDSHNFSELQEFPYIFNGKKTSNKVISLSYVFSHFGDDFIFYLDIKNRTFEFAESVIKIIKNFGLEKTTILASADFFLIARVEFVYPEINTCLEGFNAGKESVYYLIPAKFKPDYYSSYIDNVNQDHINWLKDKNLLNQKIVYGVDSSNFYRAKQFGLKIMLADFDSTSGIKDYLEMKE